MAIPKAPLSSLIPPAAPDASKPHVAPPIPDNNKNGALDIDDVITALRSNLNGGITATSVRAHPMVHFWKLLADDTSSYTRSFLKTIANDCSAEQLKAFSDTLESEIKKTALLPVDSQALAELRKSFNAAAQEVIRQRPPEETETIRAYFSAPADFTTTFNATFPKGVRLDSEQIPELLKLLVNDSDQPLLQNCPRGNPTVRER